MKIKSESFIFLISSCIALLFIVLSMYVGVNIANGLLKLNIWVVLIFVVGISFICTMLFLMKRYYSSYSDTFSLSNEDMALLYAENKSIVEQLDEAVISVDENLLITTLNKNAISMLGLHCDDIGKDVREVIDFVDFKNIIDHNQHIENKYKRINNQKLLMTAYPLYLNDFIIGATAVFRTHLEVDSLLDQISGYEQMSTALRSQKHEFQNKLHVVLGLVRMRDYEKVENYIMENVYTTNLASDYYTSRLKDDRILALFVGKEIQSKQYNVQLMLTSDSFLTKKHKPFNSDDLVIVLGNLIDNAFEAYRNKDFDEKRVVVDIFEDDEYLKITVIDQAGGIDKSIVDRIFERGVSTKGGESRGTGLSLVSEIVSIYQGDKIVTSSKEETKIEIILMKVNE